jgi:Down syndrome cell adhesion protein 1
LYISFILKNLIIILIFLFDTKVNLTQLDAQDAGLYTCSAKNFLGTQSASSFISVKSAAPYVKPMRNITALAGGLFFIQCPYSAYGSVTLNWFKGKLLFKQNLSSSFLKNILYKDT